MKLNNKHTLLLIFLTSLAIRLIFLVYSPHHPNWDEISLGYNSYSILKTGKDEWGITLPSIFRAYGDYKLPLYIYLSLPFVYLFGLNPLSIRLLSLLAGSLVPLVFYLITKNLFPKNRTLLILSALTGIFSTWSIFLSQTALEANLSLTLFLFSFYFLLSYRFGLSSFLFALTLFTYNSSRVLLPFYLLALLIALKTHLPKPNFFIFIPFFIALILVFLQTISPSGQARFSWVTILDSGAVNQINELRSQPLLGSSLLTTAVYNKATYFLFHSGLNYLSHFNPNFLFFRGGSHYQFSIPGLFLIYPLFLPFYILGILALIKNIRHKNYLLYLLFLIASPLPSAITRDAPHVLRSLNFIALSAMLLPFGLSYLKTSLAKLLIPVFIASTVISFISFPQNYNRYLVNYSSSWQQGYSQIVSYVKQNYSDYDQIYITKKYGEPHEFILFFWPWDPHSYQKDPQKIWDYHSQWYWVDGFNKFKFINDWEIKTKTTHPQTRTLLITSPNNYNQDTYHLIKTVYFLDGQPAFDILESE